MNFWDHLSSCLNDLNLGCALQGHCAGSVWLAATNPVWVPLYFVNLRFVSYGKSGQFSAFRPSSPPFSVLCWDVSLLAVIVFRVTPH